MMTLNQKVKFLIQRFRDMDIPDVKIAKDIGVSPGSIYKWMDTNTNPERASIKKIGAAFGVPIAVFDDDSIHIVLGDNNFYRFEQHTEGEKPVPFVFMQKPMALVSLHPELQTEPAISYRTTGEYFGPERRLHREPFTDEEHELLELFRKAKDSAKPVVFTVLKSHQVNNR